MRSLKYLDTARPGLAWMRAYYRKNPALRIDKAVAALKHAEALIRDPIFTAPPFEDSETVRTMRIEGTHFSLIYTVAENTVWIIDVRDPRGLRGAEAVRGYARELQQRHGIILKR